MNRMSRGPFPTATTAFALTLLLGASSAFVAVGCQNQDPKNALTYTQDAKRAYDEALEEFKAHNWVEAQNLFREVKRKYSYSKFAALADLRIADADFEQEKYVESIREYRQFVHEHRSDPEASATRAHASQRRSTTRSPSQSSCRRPTSVIREPRSTPTRS